MKTKLISIAMVLVTGATGITFACNDPLPLPIPPVPVTVSMMDITRAQLAGFGTNSAFAAAIKKLDAPGRAAVGADAWRA